MTKEYASLEDAKKEAKRLMKAGKTDVEIVASINEKKERAYYVEPEGAGMVRCWESVIEGWK